MQELVDVFMAMVVKELRGGLGLDPSGPEESPVFDLIQDIYDEAAQGRECYFCSPDVDPNKDPFTRKSKVCVTCQGRLSNMLRAFGLEPEKVFLFTTRPQVQGDISLLFTGVNPWATDKF